MLLIKIKEESAEFLRFHIYGGCPLYIKNRFSGLINFNDETKQALKVIWRNIGFDESLSPTDEEFCLIQRALSKFRCNVSVSEMNLINYIALIVHGNKDDSMVDILERGCNKILEKQNLKTI
jgi:hypothetical protein